MEKKGKIISFVTLVMSALLLTACSGSIFDLFNKSSSDKLIASTNTGSNYGAWDNAVDSSKDSDLKYKQSDVDNSVGDYSLASTGTQNILVIPVKISDYSSKATDSVRQDIYSTFFGDPSDTGWESLASYYYKSSYKKLLIQGTVSGWYDCGYSAEELSELTDSSDSNYDPTWTVLENAIKWYKKTYSSDCTEFDNDGDGLIDGVWLIYSAPDYGNSRTLANLENKDVFWAYTYGDYSVTTAYPSSPVAYRYSWASYDFMYSTQYDGALDSHTYVHETGHLMGLADYYVASEDTAYTKSYPNLDPMGTIDMMDYNIIDHNTYSKMALGWTTPYVVTDSETITLHSSETTGECVIFPTGDGWNGSPFDEYILAEFYTPTGLNKADSEVAYENGAQGFTERGVRLFHVDARLADLRVRNNQVYTTGYTDTVVSTDSEGTSFAHSNSSGYNYLNPQYRLIQAIDCTDKHNFDMDYYFNGTKKKAYAASNSSLFQSGDSFSLADYANSFPNYRYNNAKQLTMNDGSSFPYTISFSDMTTSSITLTVSKA